MTTVFEAVQSVDTAAALTFATAAHSGQKRSGGDDYITHPIRVAATVRDQKQSRNINALISAAFLHDTIEDTNTTHEDLKRMFGGLVASLVQELTTNKEAAAAIGKTEYLKKKMAGMTSYALVIKLADRLDNVRDIATARSPGWRERYRNETQQILDYIERNRVLSGTHRRLIGLIRAKLQEIG